MTAGKNNDPIGFAETNYGVANIYLYKSDYDNSILFSEPTLNIFEKEKDDFWIAECNDILGLNVIK